MRKLLLFCALIGGMIHVRAQETLTLEDCLRLGIENNLKLQTSRNEVLKARHNISENRAKLLPQITTISILLSLLLMALHTAISTMSPKPCSSTPLPDSNSRCLSTTRRYTSLLMWQRQ